MEINEKEKSNLDSKGELNAAGDELEVSLKVDENDANPEDSASASSIEDDQSPKLDQANITEDHPNSPYVADLKTAIPEESEIFSKKTVLGETIQSESEKKDKEIPPSAVFEEAPAVILVENSTKQDAAPTQVVGVSDRKEIKESTSKDVSISIVEPVRDDEKSDETEGVVEVSAVIQDSAEPDTNPTEVVGVSDKKQTKESSPKDEDKPNVEPDRDDEKSDGTETVEEEEEEEHQLDYSNYSKKQMVQVLESFLKEDNFSQVGRILKEIKKPFDDLIAQEQVDAYNKYIEEGGEKDGFEYRGDELDQRFMVAFNKLRDRKNEYFNSLEIKKEQNLKTKLEILEKLRELVDSEETGASIKALKELQVQWKEVGPVPSSQLKSLWANYNALLDRFYDNRSIYFELKELDRKKNYDLKNELCAKAEQLTTLDDIRDVIRQLNDLHEEFKHIGPVPQDDQEAVWERFKTASDAIYAKRKDYYEQLKQELKVNQIAKESLVEKVAAFAEFNSDKISEWNAKTKEIINIQKEWESIGSLPKERAKKVNKQFWAAFKGFFNKKGQFFKKIEEERKENLRQKQILVDKAEALKESEDFHSTSEELKNLQKEWKDIGPVPEKYRNEIFNNFKKACDHFFNRRRKNSQVVEKEFEVNLRGKEALCTELEQMIKSEEVDMKRVKAIEAEWGSIGFVPRNSIKKIHKRYTDAIEKITDKSDLPDEEIHKLRFKAQFNNMNFGPGSERILQKKEGALRRQIATLENDINLWKNNIDFFASSKNADKLKQEFKVKIEKANEQLTNLKEQLKIISNI
jgi:hypothetical protein